MSKNPDNTIGQGIPQDAFNLVNGTIDEVTYTQIPPINKTPVPDTSVPITPGEGIPSDAFDLVDGWIDEATRNVYPQLINPKK